MNDTHSEGRVASVSRAAAGWLSCGRGWRIGAVLLLASSAFPGPAALAMPITGLAVPGFETYDQTIPPLLEQGQIAGAAVAVAYRGRIVFARGYGYADRDTGRAVQPDTRFRIASISKVLTAALVLKLVEEGRFALDDPAFRLLAYPTPAYAGAARDPRLDRITLRHLLNHTAGWDANAAKNPLVPNQIGFEPAQWQADVARAMGAPSPASGETIVRFVVGQPLQFEPGTAWAYNNVGYLALGRLIERQTGRDYEAAVRDFVAGSYLSGLAVGGTLRHELAADEAVYYDYPGAPLQPLYLGAGNERVAQPYMWSQRSYDAAGGWCMSAIEVLRLLLALDGCNGTPPLLKPESIAAMRTANPLSTFLGYGLGWCTTNAASTVPPGTDSGHGGGNWGTRTLALRSADGDWHLVALLNGSVNISRGDEVLRLNVAASTTLHKLPDYSAAAPEHDFTWSTLGWSAWQRRHLEGRESGPLDDPDQDGWPNLVEYAAGLDPVAADVLPPIAIGRDPDGTPAVTYRRLILEHPLTWTVEQSADGVAWQSASAGSTATLNSDGTLSCRVRLPGAAQARVRVAGVGAEATVDVAVPRQPATHVVNLSSRAQVAAGANALIAGFAIAGTQPRTVLVRGAGPAMTQFGVGDPLRDPRLTIFRGSRTVAVSDNWGVNAAAIAAAAQRVSAFPFSEGSKDAAVLLTLEPGIYSAVLSDASGGVGSGLIEIYEADRGDSQLVNVSTRGRVGGDAGALTVGFVVDGDQPRRLLLRACGPSLRQFGLGEGLPDPLLRLVRQADGAELARNSGWSGGGAAAEAERRAAMQEAGAFAWPSGSADSALVVTLPPGAYTAVVTSSAQSEGIALAEVYELR